MSNEPNLPSRNLFPPTPYDLIIGHCIPYGNGPPRTSAVIGLLFSFHDWYSGRIFPAFSIPTGDVRTLHNKHGNLERNFGQLRRRLMKTVQA